MEFRDSREEPSGLRLGNGVRCTVLKVVPPCQLQEQPAIETHKLRGRWSHRLNGREWVKG